MDELACPLTDARVNQISQAMLQAATTYVNG